MEKIDSFSGTRKRKRKVGKNTMDTIEEKSNDIVNSIFIFENGILKECIDKSITRAEIPSNALKIGSCAFQGCDSLTSVIIHDGVKK